ncbi:MAG: ATP-binding protein [bacterium]|nr:ATP-binding protein [bacterium]
METLLSALFSGSPQCRSIVGQRKIGKTSLVQHLSRPTTIRDFDFQPDNYLFVYFNCQKNSYALKSTDDFYRELLSQLLFDVSGPLQDIVFSLSIESNTSNVGREWERVLRELRKEDVYVVTIFDEFEKAIVSEVLIKEGLFGSLRGYTQDNPNFAWMTCTMRLLRDLFEEAFDEYNISEIQRRSESDFFNIAPAYPVGLFEEADTLKLITSPAEFTGVTFSPEDIEVITKFSGNFPYFIQRACYHFFNAYLNGTVQRESILQQCIKESAPFWKSYWDKLDDKQQQLLFSIVNEEFAEGDVYRLESLKDASLIYEDKNGKKCPFSEEFGRFIQQLNPEFPSKGGNKIISLPIPPSELVEAEMFMDDIRKVIEESDIGHEFKKTALYDLEQARVTYKSEVYKACVVMLGAVLEGLMLGTLHRAEVLDEMKNDPDLSSKIRLRGGIQHSDYSDKALFAKAIAEQLNFEKFKELISIFIPEIEKLKIEGIQQFRNAVHPWKGIQEPTVYAEFDRARAITHISSLHILAHHILSWTP